MGYTDSLDKVVQSYFKLLSAETFVYKKVKYTPKTLRVSPGLLRGYTCPPLCGGCCFKFALLWLPGETLPYTMPTRTVQFNGQEIQLHEDTQADNPNVKCRNLNMENGRCNIHSVNPFTCDFELIRATTFSNPDTANGLTTRLYGRGWAMTRVTGEKRAMCTITPVDEATVVDIIRKLRRLEDWFVHFLLPSKIPAVLDWIDVQRTKPLEEMEPLFV